jgi:DNA-binding transcriptional ArsR family regulator
VATYEDVLDALGDRTRRRIIEVLRARPAAVGEIAAAIPVSRPAISQHLRVLRRSGLVAYDEVGTRNIYRLDLTGIEGLRAWADGFWDVALDSYAGGLQRDKEKR